MKRDWEVKVSIRAALKHIIARGANLFSSSTSRKKRAM